MDQRVFPWVALVPVKLKDKFDCVPLACNIPVAAVEFM